MFSDTASTCHSTRASLGSLGTEQKRTEGESEDDDSTLLEKRQHTYVRPPPPSLRKRFLSLFVRSMSHPSSSCNLLLLFLQASRAVA